MESRNVRLFASPDIYDELTSGSDSDIAGICSYAAKMALGVAKTDAHHVCYPAFETFIFKATDAENEGTVLISKQFIRGREDLEAALKSAKPLPLL